MKFFVAVFALLVGVSAVAQPFSIQRRLEVFDSGGQPMGAPQGIDAKHTSISIQLGANGAVVLLPMNYYDASAGGLVWERTTTMHYSNDCSGPAYFKAGAGGGLDLGPVGVRIDRHASLWQLTPSAANAVVVPAGPVGVPFSELADTGCIPTSNNPAEFTMYPGEYVANLDNYFTPPFHLGVGIQNGDVNADREISVADVFYLINFLFGGGPAPM